MGLKQPELFCELARQFPEEEFIIIAPRFATDPEYTDFSERIKGIENLTYRERVPFSEIDNYFKNAKLFVNTSTYEGFPNTFVQACKHGVPIVSLQVNPNSILDTFKLGYCVKKIEFLAKRMRELLNDKTLYDKLSSHCVEYARTYHDIKNVIKEFREMLKKTIDCRR